MVYHLFGCHLHKLCPLSRVHPGVKRFRFVSRVDISGCQLDLPCHVHSSCYQAASESSHEQQKNSTSTQQDEPPVRFSQTEAASWRARNTFSGLSPAQMERRQRMPSYQPNVVIVSVSCLLIYFLWLREENDIDDQMKQSETLQQVPGLERSTLEAFVKHGVRAGRDISAEAERLRELRALDNQAKTD